MDRFFLAEVLSFKRVDFANVSCFKRSRLWEVSCFKRSRFGEASCLVRTHLLEVLCFKRSGFLEVLRLERTDFLEVLCESRTNAMWVRFTLRSLVFFLASASEGIMSNATKTHRQIKKQRSLFLSKVECIILDNVIGLALFMGRYKMRTTDLP